MGAETVLELRLELRVEDLDALRQRPRDSVHATLREGVQTYRDVDLRLKGSTGSFRPIDDKPSFTLDFDRFAPGRQLHGMGKLHLNNSVEDPSYLNEQLGSGLFLAAGVPAPRVAHAEVWLNGRRLGLYVLKEGFTKDFLRRHFVRADGPLYRDDQGLDIEDLSRLAVGASLSSPGGVWERLLAATREGDPAERWRRLEESLDLDRFVAFMATEILIGHRDGYCLARNNFRVYQDPRTGKLVFLSHGMDQLFGRPEASWQPHCAGTVARAVLEIPAGQARYAAVFGSLLTNAFRVDELIRHVDRAARVLRPRLTRGERPEFDSSVATLKEHLRQRRACLVEQISRPAPQWLRFQAGFAHLPAGGWVQTDAASARAMDVASGPIGAPRLRIVAGPTTFAAWRQSVRLPPGRYRVEGKGRVSGVRPLPFGKRHGACLRVAGQTPPSASMLGSSSWVALGSEFDVPADAPEVEILAELRAAAGEFWLEPASVRVEALAPAAVGRTETLRTHPLDE